MHVAVLFARTDSVYKSLPDCDVWDVERDALRWPGASPVVAHPPCRAWASLRHHAKPEPGEKHLALFALTLVRRYGGVLEHPWQSTLRSETGMLEAGRIDQYGGFVLPIRQQWFGHRARKDTMLYIVGCAPSDLPTMPMKLGEATHTIGLFSGRDRERCKPTVSKREYDATPRPMAEWLVELARRCTTNAIKAAA